MCKYCRVDIAILEEPNIFTTIKNGVYLYSDDYSGCQEEALINYCPMCGKELKKEEKWI